ncbi:MAG TPA: condensation domain-containing protein, partial [Streptosporangiaceae bacterium]|nr:condensation domain-containing protein [Streptosporangiaceae bacterium]
LVRLPGAEQVLVLAADSLICDDWSLRVWVSELGLAYQEPASGLTPGPVEARAGFGDYARWQRGVLASGRFNDQAGYWRDRLAGCAPLDLIRGAARATDPGEVRGVRPLAVPEPVHVRLRELAYRERATVFSVLLAAWQALLAWHTGQPDVAVGTMAPGRGWPELEQVIGVFENPVVLRADVSGDPGFLTLVGRVREAAAGALSHAELPFHVMSRALASSGRPSPEPLLGVMFTLVGSTTPAGLDRLTATEIPLAPTTVSGDLRLELKENDDELRGWLHYRTDLFTTPEAARLVGRYLALLDSVAADPDRPLSVLLAPG